MKNPTKKSLYAEPKNKKIEFSTRKKLRSQFSQKEAIMHIGIPHPLVLEFWKSGPVGRKYGQIRVLGQFKSKTTKMTKMTQNHPKSPKMTKMTQNDPRQPKMTQNDQNHPK